MAGRTSQLGLDSFLHEAGPQTAGAHSNTASSSVNKGMDRLKVWAKHPFGPVVGVANIVAHLTVFSANFAGKWHC